MRDDDFKDVRCPECHGGNVELLSLFGSSISEVMFECRTCRTIFNWVKWSGKLPPTAMDYFQRLTVAERARTSDTDDDTSLDRLCGRGRCNVAQNSQNGLAPIADQFTASGSGGQLSKERKTMTASIVIDGLSGFAPLEGTTLGTAGPIEITQDRIDQFCRSTENTEWIHWDEERCKASPFGTTIAPGMMAAALFPKLFFDLVEIRNVDTMLFQGSDRIRLLAPLVQGARLTQTVKVGRVEPRERGLSVSYDVTWNTVGSDKPIGVATFVVRYM
ncbi:MAG: MaoC/PaaZ C-terminal domain-containing protein [Xanthobacteraceae bacterium]